MSVSASLRVVRWTSRTPSRSSSCASLRLTVDLGRPSASAAPVKLLVSATLVKTTMSLRSMAVGSSRSYASRVSRYRDVASKVDAFFARVQLRYASDLQCGSGCSDCCAVRLTVTSVEAGEISDFVAELPAAMRTKLAANVAASASRCAALDRTGRCLIYDARPIVCRSHGVPIRMRNPNSLPVVEACHRNFTEAGPAAADPSCI